METEDGSGCIENPILTERRKEYYEPSSGDSISMDSDEHFEGVGDSSDNTCTSDELAPDSCKSYISASSSQTNISIDAEIFQVDPLLVSSSKPTDDQKILRKVEKEENSGSSPTSQVSVMTHESSVLQSPPAIQEMERATSLGSNAVPAPSAIRRSLSPMNLSSESLFSIQIGHSFSRPAGGEPFKHSSFHKREELLEFPGEQHKPANSFGSSTRPGGSQKSKDLAPNRRVAFQPETIPDRESNPDSVQHQTGRQSLPTPMQDPSPNCFGIHFFGCETRGFLRSETAKLMLAILLCEQRQGSVRSIVPKQRLPIMLPV